MTTVVSRRERWTLRLLWFALVLAVVVVGASSYLRLAGNGLGCEPWPACYGTAEAFVQANGEPVVRALRLTHRVTASLFLVVVFATAWMGWPRWRRSERAQAVALLVVTVALAAIGRFTPSSLPWITWANVLGGFALIGLTLALAMPHNDAGPAGPRRVVALVLLVLLALQVLGGALLSVRLAAAECQPACAHAPGGNLVAMWQPARTGNATALSGSAGGAALLQGLHRVGGLLLVLGTLGVVALSVAGRAARALGLAAGAAVITLGFVLTHVPQAGIGAAHAVAAACIIAVLALRLRPAAG